jgi:hypothetical protein
MFVIISRHAAISAAINHANANEAICTEFPLSAAPKTKTNSALRFENAPMHYNFSLARSRIYLPAKQ